MDRKRMFGRHQWGDTTAGQFRSLSHSLLPPAAAGIMAVNQCYPAGRIRGVPPMTQLLEQALAEIRKLPEPEQDAIAALILEELADERRWDEAFAPSQGPLARLAAKVREDTRAGRVRGVGMDEL